MRARTTVAEKKVCAVEGDMGDEFPVLHGVGAGKGLPCLVSSKRLST